MSDHRAPAALTVEVKRHFSAGHRIRGLSGPAAKCANLHGHTFGVEVEVYQGGELTVEFTMFKKVLWDWIDKFLDHGYIVHEEDWPLLQFLRENALKHYVTPHRPTTEEIATVIYYAVQQLFPGVRLRRITVTEGPHNSATAWGDESA